MTFLSQRVQDGFLFVFLNNTNCFEIFLVDGIAAQEVEVVIASLNKLVLEFLQADGSQPFS